MKVSGRKTVAERLAEFGPAVAARLSPHFLKENVQYPPSEVVLMAFKAEKDVEVYARNAGENFKKICTYPILAASGKPGPKLKEGDRQVPEGIYGIEYLNPNSLYHLSMKISYPNEFDQRIAMQEGRTSLGGDIMIHGNQVSIGCLAMGDEAAEDLFVLVAQTGLEKVKVIISPVDFRRNAMPDADLEEKAWVTELYHQIREELARYK